MGFMKGKGASAYVILLIVGNTVMLPALIVERAHPIWIIILRMYLKER